MIGKFLKRQFDSGGAGIYVFAVTPVSLVVAFALPPSFAPFIMAAAFFPAYFYFTRRGAHLKAMLFLAVWAMMEFSALSSVVLLNPAVVAGALGLTAPNPLATAFGWRMADLVYSAALSVVSGGAFFLVKAAVKINDTAFHFASLLYAGNITGAVFSLAPWKIMTGAGHVISAQGSASVFYAKLEGATVKWKDAGWMILAGLAMVIIGWLLETLLQRPWFLQNL
ncbi:MAG: hypothetical protein HQK86_13630 [Nitrospinae bacterium]|nr:hypothetical protein [Nitrospinota bacterium]